MNDKAKIVCLCGSTRFLDTFVDAYIRESLAGKVVLTVAGYCRDRPDYAAVKPMLDAMYLKKIELADEVLVLNVGGYMGDSTKREVEYARTLGKRVRWWEDSIEKLEGDEGSATSTSSKGG